MCQHQYNIDTYNYSKILYHFLKSSMLMYPYSYHVRCLCFCSYFQQHPLMVSLLRGKEWTSDSVTYRTKLCSPATKVGKFCCFLQKIKIGIILCVVVMHAIVLFVWLFSEHNNKTWLLACRMVWHGLWTLQNKTCL
jgi:hypothetical protein